MLLLKLQCRKGSDQKFAQHNSCLNNTEFWLLNYSSLGGLELPHQTDLFCEIPWFWRSTGRNCVINYTLVSMPYVLKGSETKKFAGKGNKNVTSHLALPHSLQSQHGHQPKLEHH